MLRVEWTLIFVLLVMAASGANGQAGRYLGCFFDSYPDRIMPDLTSCPDFASFCNNFCSGNVPYCQSSSNMSVTNCLRLCSSQSLAYAGVQAGTQCFCGSGSTAYDMYGSPTDMSSCRSICSGDATQSCGSDYRMQVYEIGCLPITAPLNSTLSQTNESFFEIGRMLNITCHPGFILTGPSNLTCLPTGEWNDPSPSCLRDVCTRPEPPPGSTPRGNRSRESTEFPGGESLLFDCEDSGATVNLTCVEREWLSEGVCTETMTTIVTEIVTTEITEDYQPTTETNSTAVTDGNTTEVATSSPMSNETTAGVTDGVTNLTTDNQTTDTQTTADQTTDTQTTDNQTTDTQTTADQTTGDQTTDTPLNETSTTSDGNAPTSALPVGSKPLTTAWLIFIVGCALFLFVIVLFLAVLFVGRRKSKRDQTSKPKKGAGQEPKAEGENMSQMNLAYEETELPNQNGHQTSGTSNGHSGAYDQPETSANAAVKSENDSAHVYAKPASPALSAAGPGQSQATPNEYASPQVDFHSSKGENHTETTPTAASAPPIPEPDYDGPPTTSAASATRMDQGYIEFVTKV